MASGIGDDFPTMRFQRAGFNAGQIAAFQAQFANASPADQAATALKVASQSDYQVAVIASLPTGSGAGRSWK